MKHLTQQSLFEMISYYGSDIKRINHALKVYGYAQAICLLEDLDDQAILITELAAIFHDIGIPEAERKHGSSAGKFQELEGPPVVKNILQELDVDDEVIERVCFLVGNHHSYTKIDGTDFQILVEADFLVNIVEDGYEGKQIARVGEKYFKTPTGKKLFESMFRDKMV